MAFLASLGIGGTAGTAAGGSGLLSTASSIGNMANMANTASTLGQVGEKTGISSTPYVGTALNGMIKGLEVGNALAGKSNQQNVNPYQPGGQANTTQNSTDWINDMWKSMMTTQDKGFRRRRDEDIEGLFGGY